jgi:hypothetical protein
MLKLFSP